MRGKSKLKNEKMKYCVIKIWLISSIYTLFRTLLGYYCSWNLL